MKQLLISKNIRYLFNIGVEIDDSLIDAVEHNSLPELDDLIRFSNHTGISINDFLFVDIEQK